MSTVTAAELQPVEPARRFDVAIAGASFERAIDRFDVLIAIARLNIHGRP